MLQIRHLTKTFHPGTQDERTALRDICLEVNTGEFITVIGANGAGKSTLFNAISGTFFPDSGTILLDGRDITRMPPHRRSRVIGQLFQDPLKGSAPNMSIAENLALASGRGGWFSSIKKKDREDFRERLRLLGMGLEDRMDQPVGLLSGGQRQALTLLMATFSKPQLLLLDEHTAALDPGTAEKVLKLTEETVAQDHLTCLMVTHNMQSALDLGNRTLMMDQGRIILDTQGDERRALTVPALLEKFRELSGAGLDNDRMMLA